MCGVETILIVLALQNELLKSAITHDLEIGYSKEIRQQKILAEIEAILAKCKSK